MDLLDGLCPRNNPHGFISGATYKTSYGHAKVTSVSAGGLANFTLLAPSDEAKEMGWKKGATFVAHPEDNTSPSPRSWLMIKSPHHGSPSVCIASYCGKKARAGKSMCTEHLKTHPLRPRPDLQPSKPGSRRAPRKNPRKPGKYPGFVIQTIEVPVKYSRTEARKVAERHGAKKGGKIDEKPNYYRFRQVDPAKMTKKYISLKLPNSVIIVKALPKATAKRAKIENTSKKLTVAERKRLLAL